jgi:hypothetical protein
LDLRSRDAEELGDVDAGRSALRAEHAVGSEVDPRRRAVFDLDQLAQTCHAWLVFVMKSIFEPDGRMPAGASSDATAITSLRKAAASAVSFPSSP